MRSRLGVDGNDVGASLGEGLDIGVDGIDHQMNVENPVGMRTQRFHHARPEGDVGHEVSIHHIEMNPVGAGGGDIAHFLAEPGEIGGEDGGAMMRSVTSRFSFLSTQPL